MARYTGPKCRLCRREGVKLFLKGARCESEKCAVTRRHTVPGQHGSARKKKAMGYEIQLREKQKTKRIYGVMEKQFVNYVKRALRLKEVTGEALMQMLESRLDNVVYRAGFAASHAQARQFIRSAYFSVNGKVVTIPSIQIGKDDVVACIRPEKISIREVTVKPEWISVDDQKKSLQVVSMPTLDQLEQMNVGVNPQLIVEFYSR